MMFSPVQELEVLRMKTHLPNVKSLKPGDKNPLDAISAELVEIRVEFEPGDAKEVVFNIRDIMVEYDVAKQEISVAGHRAPAPLREGKQRLIIYCDRTGAEVFASDGLCYVPMPFNTKPENKRLYFETRGGTATVNVLEVHELRSAWTVQ
jgi:sucrose-6-phosphate hydrolase SacC (GH32 family)